MFNWKFLKMQDADLVGTRIAARHGDGVGSGRLVGQRHIRRPILRVLALLGPRVRLYSAGLLFAQSPGTPRSAPPVRPQRHRRRLA